MCDFFSFITVPTEKKILYFDWEQRQKIGLSRDCDSHRAILDHYVVKTDLFNAYEYNPLTGDFVVDAISGDDDSKHAEEWVKSLDFGTIVKPLIIKPVVNPFELPERIPTNEDIALLKEWATVRDTVRDTVWDTVGDTVGDTVWATVWDTVGDTVWDTVGDMVWDTVWDTVWDMVWATVGDTVGDTVRDTVRDTVWATVWDTARGYIGSFFDIKYPIDTSSVVKLWERGLVPSYDGKTWRLHTGKNAKIVYEWVNK